MNFIVLVEPSWLDVNNLLNYLPNEEPMNLASLRSWILLADSDVARKLCPQEYECIPPEICEKASSILDYIFSELYDAYRQIEGTSSSKVDDLIRRLIEGVDEKVRGFGATECVGIECLGCFLPYVLPNVKEEVGCLRNISGPIIVVNVDLVEEVVNEVVNNLKLANDPHVFNDLSRSLLASVITHEVTHAFTDLSTAQAPKCVFRNMPVKFYYRMIEESIATYYQVKKLGKSILRNIYVTYLIAKLLTESTLEYRAGIVWELTSDADHVSEVLKAWTGLTAPARNVITFNHLMSIIEAILGPPALLIRRMHYHTFSHYIFREIVWHFENILRKTLHKSCIAVGSLLKALTTAAPYNVVSLLWRLLALNLAALTPRGNLLIRLI